MGLVLMWLFANWKKKTKWIVTGIIVTFVLVGGCTSDDATDEVEDTAEDTETEEVALEEEAENPTELEERTRSEAVEEEPVENEIVEEDVEVAEVEVEEGVENDIISITESEDYVIDIKLIVEEYSVGTEENIEVFSPENEDHYRIQMDHHGGFLGSQNLDRIKELIENITDVNAEYDYLVFEILRTDRDEGDRWIYTRFNQEQANDLLNKEEVDDDTFEQVSDFFVSGGDADIGFSEGPTNFDDMTTEEMVEVRSR